VKSILQRLGPGFVTGTSDDDPAGIGTYLQVGAQFRFGLLWTALFTTPIMYAVQEMAGRIGMVTGCGLGRVLGRTYAWPIVWFIIVIQVVTNTINIGADLGAMAQSLGLVWHIPFGVLLALAAIVMTLLITLVPYKHYANALKFFGLLLLSYVAAAFTVHVNWGDALRSTVIPHVELTKDFVLAFIAVLGVTISPYEFFWQSNEEVEELLEEGRLKEAGASLPSVSESEIRDLNWDTAFGMFFSNAITFFVIITAAATLFVAHKTNIQTAADAAEALMPLAGPHTFLLFMLGIVASGLLSVPVMAASSGYAICGALGVRSSLGCAFRDAPHFYGIIALSCLIGVIVNLFHVPPFKLLYYSGVLNGIISPFLLCIITLTGSNKSVMGRYTNNWWSNAVGYGMAAVMTAALVAFFVLNK